MTPAEEAADALRRGLLRSADAHAAGDRTMETAQLQAAIFGALTHLVGSGCEFRAIHAEWETRRFAEPTGPCNQPGIDDHGVWVCMRPPLHDGACSAYSDELRRAS